MNENEGKGRILLIANMASYLVISMKQALISCDCDIVEIDSKKDRIPKIEGEIDLILMYLDETVTSRSDIGIFTKDYATEWNVKVFVIGSPQEIADISLTVPNSVIEERFTRPIDSSMVVTKISTYIEKHAKSEKKLILAVDDSGVFLREINGWFSGKYQVALANSGMGAIKYLASHKPDLILLDYEMPVCNGKMVLEMIRSDTECGDVPVVFLTGNTDRNSIIQIMPLKVTGYLLKTLPAEEIIKYVDDFFKKQRMR